MCSADGCPGLGRAYFRVFAFDTALGTCGEQFFGGVRKSANNFDSLEDCAAKCGDGGASPLAATSSDKPLHEEALAGMEVVSLGPPPKVYESQSSPAEDRTFLFGRTSGAAGAASPSSSSEVDAQTSKTRGEGCCFSFGYGAFMVPCCLNATRVSDVSTCSVQIRGGGASSYSVGRCPSTAQEANVMYKAKRDRDSSEQARRPTSVATRGPLASPSTLGASQPAPKVAESAPRTSYLDYKVFAMGLLGILVVGLVLVVQFRNRRCEIRTPFLRSEAGDAME